MDLVQKSLDIKEQRIFIGNLPNDVKLSHLYCVLPPGFDKSKLEIKHNYDIDNSITSSFAFINLKGTSPEIKAWCDIASKKSIGGNVLDVQFAKQSFLERLREEVNSQKIKSVSEEKNELTKAPKVSRKVNPNLSKFNSGESSSSELNNSEIEENDKITSDESELSKEKTYSNAEIRRLESLQERLSAHVSQQNIIKNAINTTSSRSANKIIFDDSEDEEVLESQPTECNKRKLFDNSESDDDTVAIDFSESKPKLIRTKISAFDERFRMDSRFFDKEKNTSVQEDSQGGDAEKSNILKIVDSIIQKDPTFKPPKLKNKKEIQTIFVPRFDPLEKNHTSLVIKKDEEIENIVEKKPKIKPFKVSKDRYYDVSDNLKEQFKNNDNTTSFSLMGLFSGGQTEVPDFEEFHNKDEVIEKKQKSLKNVKNPIVKGVPNFFNIEENSDSEGEKDIKKACESNATSLYEPLFITTRDPRVIEAMQFFNTPPDETLPHAVISSNLRKIVKKKYQRNMAKRKLFKNKLGTQRKFQKGNEKKKKKTETAPTIK